MKNSANRKLNKNNEIILKIRLLVMASMLLVINLEWKLEQI